MSKGIDLPHSEVLRIGPSAWTRDQLMRLVALQFEQIKALPDHPIVLRARADVGFIGQLLACLRAEKPVALFNPSWTAPEQESRRKVLGQSLELNEDGSLARTSGERPAGVHPQTRLILFTSGSTGAPKAVQLSGRNIEAQISAVIRSLDFHSVTQQHLFLPLSYSFGVLGQLLPALHSGVRTTLYESFSEALLAFKEGAGEGMLSGVPSHWETMLRVLDGAGVLSSVTHVVSAGAPLPLPLRSKLMERFPLATIYNNYGQTEASPRILSFSSRDPLFLAPSTAGYPVGDFEVKVNAQHELLVKGSQVMLGYLDDPAETSRKIDQGWLNTGDLATIRENGLIEISGRGDDLVNVGGERLSSQEIEDALRRVEGIVDAAVIFLEDQILGVTPIAFIVSAGDQPLDHQWLVGRIRQRLSTVKIPRQFIRLEKLPLTDNGKIDRVELRRRAGG